MVEKIGVIPIHETIFNPFNFWVTGGLFLVFLLVLFLCEKYLPISSQKAKSKPLKPINGGKEIKLGGIIGLLMLLIFGINYFPNSYQENSTINLNLVNFTLFRLTLFLYKPFSHFTKAMTEGPKTSVDIFIQFPFYSGIMGLMTQSGLLVEFSNLAVSFSDQSTLPVFSFCGDYQYVNSFRRRSVGCSRTSIYGCRKSFRGAI